MGIAAILGLILPAIPGLIDTVEKLINAPKSGDTKMGVVLQALRALITGIHATSGPLVPGAPATPQPTDDELRAVIETVLAQKAASGTLGASAPSIGQLYLVQGSVTSLSMVKLSQ